jgi:hypothetical protein
VFKRLLSSVILGLLTGTIISEAPFIFLRESSRAPREIVLTIPAGTADQVKRGEQPPSIPQNMTFVVGDRLVVRNEDSADHKLGPLFIPANSSAQLALDQEESLSYECSFQPGKVFGLDVQEPVTLGTRLFGIVFVGFPMAILFALLGFFVVPRKEQDAAA